MEAAKTFRILLAEGESRSEAVRVPEQRARGNGYGAIFRGPVWHCMGSREELERQGFTVAKAILPPQLVEKLVAACDVAREIARREIGPSAQRLQPAEAAEALAADAA